MKMEKYKPALTLCAFVHILALVKFSIGLDTLFPDQTFVVGQTLISPNQLFEMGFFNLGSPRYKFLGIWYKDTPGAVVWVANRDKPFIESEDLFLVMDRNGNLVISNGGGILWTTNLSGIIPPNPILQLLNTGNLVVVDHTSESSFQNYPWQSFDYPTDTWLRGMKLVNDIDAGVEKFLRSWKSSDDPSSGDAVLKIVNQGLAQIVIFKGTKRVFRSGTWNGVYFSGSPPFDTPIFHPELVFDKERLISISLPYDSSIISRLVLENSGYIKHFILYAKKTRWHLLSIDPEEPCNEYGHCGPFAICASGLQKKCQCLTGYSPKFQNDWDLQDWSSGCTRTTPFNCTIEDHGFQEVTGVKYPDMFQFLMNNSLSLSECRALCLGNCSCKAYANPYINGANGCVMWFDQIIDTRYLPRADTKQKLYIRVLNSELGSDSSLRKGETNWPMILILIAIVSGVFVSCLINGGIHYLATRMRQEAFHKDLELPLYKLSTIMIATNNFSKENLIGEGGFGHVYRGNLSLEVEVAVKRLSRTSGQGLAEFKNEIMSIAKLQHRNLVRLLGCCIERDERILIYEYMPNKSLDTFVFDQNRKTLLTWPKRFDIIMGISRGLLYLHHDSRLKVIHRDLKTSNILLDRNLNPKISDFGLARTFEEEQSCAKTKRVVGTYGYMSPEYALAGKFSMKSDIFSFGVVLLEIISGQKNRGFGNYNEYNSLLEHAWLLWKEKEALELMDECLSNTFIESQVKRCVQVALLCVQKYVEDRPDMISVCSMLGTEEPILLDPKEPGFFIERSSKSMRTFNSTREKSRNETLTITDLEAR